MSIYATPSLLVSSLEMNTTEDNLAVQSWVPTVEGILTVILRLIMVLNVVNT